MVTASDINVLIVEDEPDFCKILVTRFSMFGFTVNGVSSGNEAWDLMQKTPCDIVISDVRMPNGSGIELLKNIRQADFSSPKVFMISGFSDLPYDEILNLGSDGFFPKPFNATDLRDTIQKALIKRDDRWSVKPKAEPFRNIQLSWNSWDAANSKGLFRMGRGGFCAVMDHVPPKNGAIVSFDISLGKEFTLQGQGRVLWKMPLSADRTRIGVEITYLNSDSLATADTWIEKNKPNAYIPNC